MDMNLPMERRHIGDHQYTVIRLAFRPSRQLLALLEKTLGPSLLQLLTEIDMKSPVSSLVDMDAKAFISAVLQLLSRISSPDVDEIFSVLGKATRVNDDGKEKILDALTQDNWWALHPAECLPWLAFAVEVQYRDFFVGAGRHLSALGATKANP